MSAHSLFAPSKAHRWLHCVGSIAEEQAYPETSSDYADEGSAAHTLAQRALDCNKDARFYLGEVIIPRVCGKQYIVTEDMARFVQVYLDEIRSRVLDGILLVEERVIYATVEDEEQGGTSDAAILSGDGETLTVADLKYGMGVKVFAKDNEQMKCYALGLLKKYAAILDQVKQIKLLVIQPRIDHIDEWPREGEYPLTPAALFDFENGAVERMKEASHAIALRNAGQPIPDEYYAPEEKTCRFCPHKANCDALRRMAAKSVYDDFAALDNPVAIPALGEPQPPAGDRLGAMFGGTLDLIEGWVRACRAEIVRRVSGGMTVIGPDGLPMKLAEGRKGNMKWTDEDAAKPLLEGILPREKVYEPEALRTPSQIKTALGKKRLSEWTAVLEPLTKRSPGAVKVVLGSDPAPPFNGAATADEFDIIQQTE
jgi:hypothetical protein